ncbi:glycosyltransferase [Acinetobacter baumannii]|uniref:glycosyltransferase n=1 Tax=Acinetobacter baumannii TaxID=470 RepID=UPI0039060734
MKKILFIVDNLGKGGAQSITSALANFLSRSSLIKVTVCTLDNTNQECHLEPSVELISLNICHDFSYGKLWKRKTLTKAEQVMVEEKINKRNYNLIILGFHNGYYLYDYLRQKENIWFWVHGEILERRAFKNIWGQLRSYLRYERHKIYFKQLLKGKRIVIVSKHLEEAYKKILESSEFVTIPNGIELPENTNRFNSKNWDALFLGRLVNLKQVDHTIKAFYKANVSGKLGILGDGPEILPLKNLVNKLNLQNRVDFLGWSSSPQDFICQSRCVVMSSSSEGSPISLLQALSLDVPIVSYNSSSSIALLFDNPIMNRYLIPKNDIEKLAIALKECINHPYDIPKEVKSIIDMETMVKSFINLIQD